MHYASVTKMHITYLLKNTFKFLNAALLNASYNS